MLFTICNIIIVSYVIYKSGAARQLLNLARMENRTAAGSDSKQAPPVISQEKEKEPALAEDKNKTYLYHYNGLLVADTLQQLQTAALKIAHERGDFLRREKVNTKINKSGLRWTSYAYNTIMNLTPAQLIAYIEGRPYSNIK